jgi:hypothetical protein
VLDLGVEATVVPVDDGEVVALAGRRFTCPG